MAGDAGVLKHASNVPRCALAIEEVFRRAGFPSGLFRTVLADAQVVKGLIADPRIVAATLTGSERAGRAVAEQAGRQIKKTVLELGGSDPFVVLADADLDVAAKGAAEGRLVNSGQSCIASKRFIVVDAVADRFLERFREELASRRMGDPTSRDTQVGPQARVDLRDELHQQVAESVKRGARTLLGGAVPAGRGAFYPPTLLSMVDRGMPAFDEETFGPWGARYLMEHHSEVHGDCLLNGEPSSPLTIRFDNLGRERVDVYLIGAKREWILGRVEPGATASLRIPEEALAKGLTHVRLAVLQGERLTFQAARNPRARLTIAQPASAILSQRWSFSQGALTSLGR